MARIPRRGRPRPARSRRAYRHAGRGLVLRLQGPLRHAGRPRGAAPGDGRRARAVTQLFTCLTAVVPIVAAGLAPAYCDVSARTASLRPGAPAAPPPTRAPVMLQHTYGIIDDAESAELARRARRRGRPSWWRDSAHCVLPHGERTPRASPSRTVSVHSFGVEKILPTHFGGRRVGEPQKPPRRPRVRGPRRPRRAPRSARAPGRPSRGATAPRTASSRTCPPASRRACAARSSPRGAMEPAVSEAERRGLAAREPVRASAWVCERALAALAGLDGAEALRRETVAAYRAELAGASNAPGRPRGPRPAAPALPRSSRRTRARADRVVAGGLRRRALRGGVVPSRARTGRPRRRRVPRPPRNAPAFRSTSGSSPPAPPFRPTSAPRAPAGPPAPSAPRLEGSAD